MSEFTKIIDKIMREAFFEYYNNSPRPYWEDMDEDEKKEWFRWEEDKEKWYELKRIMNELDKRGYGKVFIVKENDIIYKKDKS